MLDLKLGYTTTQVSETETLTSVGACCYIDPIYRKLFTPEIEKWIDNYFDKKGNSAIINNKQAIVLYCIGKSNCSSEDIFDEYVGGKISLAKGKIKIYRFMKNLCKKIISEFMPLLTGTDIATAFYYKNSIFADYIRYETLETNERIYLKKLINK